MNKVAYIYTQEIDLIAREDLRFANRVRNNPLSKSIFDQGWGYLRNRFIDTAVNAGRQIVLVDPAYTSKTCSYCGQLFHDLKTFALHRKRANVEA